jgi:hypothetical protein
MHDEFQRVRDGFSDMVLKLTVQSMGEKILKGTATLNQKMKVPI